jgi:hypothetical protein
MEDMMEDSFRRPFGFTRWPGMSRIMEEIEPAPSVDIYEEGDDIVLKSEMPGRVNWFHGSLLILQSKGSQFRACRLVIPMNNAANSQTFCDLDKQRGVFDIDYLPGRDLGDVQRKTKEVRVGLAYVDKNRRK